MEFKEAREKIEDIIKNNNEDLIKKIEILGLFTAFFNKLEVKPIVVGGQAVEFYTSGGYSTMDIDILCESDMASIEKIFKNLGYKKDGKYWVLEKEDFTMAIEIPSGPLSGDRKKITEVKTKQGYDVYFIGIEDIIIDRLNSYKYWNEYSDKEWILGMISVNYSEIDWNYLKSRSKEEGTENELKALTENNY